MPTLCCVNEFGEYHIYDLVVGFVVSEFVYLDIRNIIYTNIKKMAYNAEQFGSVLGKFLHTASFHCTEEYFSRTTESFFFFLLYT